MYYFPLLSAVMDLAVNSFALEEVDNEASSNFKPGESRRYAIELTLVGAYSSGAGSPNFDYEFLIGQDQTTYLAADIIPRRK